jgi:hypothetical protein
MNAADFSLGPFLEVRKRLEGLGRNLYCTQTFTRAMEDLKVIQKEYQTALSSSDLTLIEHKRSELEYYETIIALSAQNFMAPEKEDEEATHD